MHNYHPSSESVSAVLRMVQRLEDPAEFTRISGQMHLGSIRLRDLPSRATIAKHTVRVSEPAKAYVKNSGHYEPVNREKSAKLTQPEKDHIIRLAGEGLNCLQIGQQLDIHSMTVMTHLRRCGITATRTMAHGKANKRRTPNADKMTPNVIQSIKTLAALGKNSAQIAWHTSIDRQYISDWCKRFGVSLTPCNYAYVVCQKTGSMIHRYRRTPMPKAAQSAA